MEKTLEFSLFRDTIRPEYTLGILDCEGRCYGYTVEDADRRMEEGGEKIPGQTAIPRGRYKIVLSMSSRFKKIMPEILDVPGFSGIRIHGGNTHLDTEGCLILGTVRTVDGTSNCAPAIKRMIERIAQAEAESVECWIRIR